MTGVSTRQVLADEQDYIPGTEVIRNLIGRSPEQPHGTPDQNLLNRAETMFVSDRIDQLRMGETEGAFTFTRMRAIHRHLFQDVYAWAGEPRHATMSKLGTEYAHPREMNSLLRAQFTALAEQDFLRGVSDGGEFTRRLSTFWAEINHAHAFREGNTRSQTVFFEQLCHEAGWHLDVARLAPRHPQSLYRAFVAARFGHQRERGEHGQNASHAASELAGVLSVIVSPDPSAEGLSRRAQRVVVIDKSGAATNPLVSDDALRGHYQRFPELRDLAQETGIDQPGSTSRAGDDYQP